MDIKNLLTRIDGIIAEEHSEQMPSEVKENLLKSFERELKENPKRQVHRDLMREYKEYVAEYGGVGGYGAASQAPQGSTSQTSDPKADQLKLDQAQIAKSTGALKSTLNQQGAATPMNPVKFQDVMNKLNAAPNTNLSNQEQNQMGPLAVAASKIMQTRRLPVSLNS